MAGEILQGPEGTWMHINYGRGRKPKTCPFCKKNPVAKECDFDIGNGKTCDASMCAQCATQVGRQDTKVFGEFVRKNDTKDYCPIHKPNEAA